MNHLPDDQPIAVVKRERTELEVWTDRFAAANGGRGRRKVARAYKRSQQKKVVVANRRRFREFESNRMTASTIGQQLRLLAGEFGPHFAQARIESEYRKIAASQEVEYDAMIAEMRVQLGLDELVSAE